MSGQSKYRSLWEQYYEEAEAIIFVIDSADRLRIKVAQNELENLIDHPCKQFINVSNINKAIKKRNVPILFFANKMDLGQAMTEAEVAKEMLLHQLTDR
jgi:ADP-ribosylation factor-like protein 6